MQSAVSPGGVSQPPFKIRDADRLNREMGRHALPHSYVQVPIHVFNNDDIHDDVSADGCPFIGEVENSRVDSEEVFGKY